MKHVYEFEVFLDEGRYTVWPFDFECGGTSGAISGEACEMAVDWLKTVVEDYAMHDEATRTHLRQRAALQADGSSPSPSTPGWKPSPA
ncbi:MAG: hypothetical protein ACLSVD_16630 [Eggerthellaceae bacterium]